MIPVLFHLGPLTVYSFGLMMALGFLAADYVIRLECVRRGFDPEAVNGERAQVEQDRNHYRFEL